MLQTFLKRIFIGWFSSKNFRIPYNFAVVCFFLCSGLFDKLKNKDGFVTESELQTYKIKWNQVKIYDLNSKYRIALRILTAHIFMCDLRAHIKKWRLFLYAER